MSSAHTIVVAGEYNAVAVEGSTAVVNVTTYQPAPPPSQEQVAVARARLGRMPTTRVPAPRPLPLPARVPFVRNSLFVGRDVELCALARSLRAGRTTVLAAATGMGGIGKTQLAVEFAHRYGHYFAGGVFWVDCSEPGGVVAEVVACGLAEMSHLMPDFHTRTLEEQLQLVLASWQSPVPRLIVFDNCEDAQLLSRWLPRTGGARVLITSRRAVWPKHLDIHTLALDVLDRPASIALLRRFRPDLDACDPVLDQIAAEVGDLPLALHLVGCYLDRYRHLLPPAAVLEELRGVQPLAHPAMQGADLSPTAHIQHVGQAFQISYRRLDPLESIDSCALRLAAAAARFAPGAPLPRPLARAAVLPAEGAPMSELQRVELAIRRLAELGLVTLAQDGALLVHRLISAYIDTVADDVSDDVERALLQETCRLEGERDLASLLALHPHMHLVVQRGVARHCAAGHFEAAVDMLLDTHGHFVRWSDHQALAGWYQQALSAGGDGPHVLYCLHNLGVAYEDGGSYQLALQCYERALTIAHEHGDRSAVGALQGNLGNCYGVLGDSEQAIAHYRDALASAEAEGNRSLEAKWLINLGVCADRNGDLALALDYYDRAAAIIPLVSEPELAHELDLVCTLNRGACNSVAGRFDMALAAYDRALALVRLGGDTRYEAVCMGNIASCMKEMGETDAAISLLEQALELCRARALRPQMPPILHSLAESLLDKGLYDKALDCAAQGVLVAEEIGSARLAAINQHALAWAQLQSGQLGDSIATITSACERASGKHAPLIYSMAGIVNFRAGKEQQAEQYFHLACTAAMDVLRKSPHSYRAQNARGVALAGLARIGGEQYAQASDRSLAAARQITSAPGVLARVRAWLALLSQPATADKIIHSTSRKAPGYT